MVSRTLELCSGCWCSSNRYRTGKRKRTYSFAQVASDAVEVGTAGAAAGEVSAAETARVQDARRVRRENFILYIVEAWVGWSGKWWVEDRYMLNGTWKRNEKRRTRKDERRDLSLRSTLTADR